MKTPKILLNLTRQTDNNLESLALAISAALTGNNNFPEPQPALAEFNDSIKTFSDALALAKSRDKVKVATKNAVRQALILQLRKMANYCNLTADGDRAKLVSAGFAVSAPALSTKTLSAPQNFTVQAGLNSGEAIVSIKRIPSAIAYLLLYRPASGNAEWTHTANSMSSFSISGLTALESYQFKIAAIGTKGQMVYTDTLTTAVL